MTKDKTQNSKQSWLWILAAAVIITAVVIWSPWAPASSAAPAEAHGQESSLAAAEVPLEITVEEAYRFVEEGAFLLDVRTQEEWDEYHAPQAELIPLDELPARINELPEDQLIVTICRSGNRSAAARDYLLDAGFNPVTSSAGGMQAWASADFPIE